jgi:hypothetical protein
LNPEKKQNPKSNRRCKSEKFDLGKNENFVFTPRYKKVKFPIRKVKFDLEKTTFCNGG